MRGRKRLTENISDNIVPHIKKESPNEGTETKKIDVRIDEITDNIKKESPNEGTETAYNVPQERVLEFME